MERVPDQTINRLPVYLRCLIRMRGVGVTTINSLQLAHRAGTNAAQVRKDFNYLGELGTRGIGYDVDSLVAHISEVLGVVDRRRVAIVGFGRLGSSLLGYVGFWDRGFDIVAAFDADPGRIGTVDRRRGDEREVLTVRPIDAIETDLRELDIEIVILATPANVAQKMAERVVDSGVKSILNFAPLQLHLPDDVRVRTVDLAIELQVLSYHLAQD